MNKRAGRKSKMAVAVGVLVVSITGVSSAAQAYSWHGYSAEYTHDGETVWTPAYNVTKGARTSISASAKSVFDLYATVGGQATSRHNGYYAEVSIPNAVLTSASGKWVSVTGPESETIFLTADYYGDISGGMRISSSGEDNSDPNLKVMMSPTTEGDKLPDSIASSGGFADLDPDSIRRVGEHESVRYWSGMTSSGEIGFVSVLADGTAALTVETTAEFQSRGLGTNVESVEAGDSSEAYLVPDGYQLAVSSDARSASGITQVGNVIVVDSDVSARDLTLEFTNQSTTSRVQPFELRLLERN